MLGLMLCLSGITGHIKAQAAAGWPTMTDDLTAEAAIVMDADSGAVLWGKDINDQYCPASITKLMTALIVLENCSLEENVEIAAEAVNSLEAGASNVGLGAGDVLTVDELLHAMLLRSANDAANALACYVSGSIEAFGELMTERAAQLGCKGTIFRNPSGLTQPENLTTAYDMALIASECVRTPGFLEVESRLSYKVSGDSKYPDGFTVNQEHKMLLTGTDYSDSRVIAGKTGFIKASGNTLVTIAEENGLRVVAVVLRDKNPDHYKDTKKLLDFAFAGFIHSEIADPVRDYAAAERLVADKIISDDGSDLRSENGSVAVTLPTGGELSNLKASYDYNIGAQAPEHTVAKLTLKYDGVNAGSTYILNEKVSDIAVLETEDTTEGGSFTAVSPAKIITIGFICVLLLAAATVVLICLNRAKAERERRERRLERRRKRLQELNVSEDEFKSMVRQEYERQS